MSAAVITAERIPAGKYTVDPKHSNVSFAVRHMGIATVRGSFQQFAGRIDASDRAPVLEGVVDVASVTTGDEQRDGHLRSPEFFDVERHPSIRFHSTASEITDDGAIRLNGEIEIKGVTKPIELVGTVAQGATDPWGQERVGFEVDGLIDRRDFGLNWNQPLPAGGVLVANEVKLLVSVSAVKE
jgi:polyisoprenoid-binding protein YceI